MAKYAIPPMTYPGTTALGEAAKAFTKNPVSMMTRPKFVVTWMIPKKMPLVEVIVIYVPLWFPEMGACAEAEMTRSYRLPIEPTSGTVKALAVKKQRMMRIVKVWI